MRILGVDPGSRLTGYGIIEVSGRKFRHVVHGTLRLANTSGKATIPLQDRLLQLHQELSAVIHEFHPEVMAIEHVFFAKNALSALKLGQARGAALLTAAIAKLEIAEYSPTQVKQTLVGFGQAEKEQVARMVQLHLGQLQFKTTDASDALALAICHAILSPFNRLQNRATGATLPKE